MASPCCRHSHRAPQHHEVHAAVAAVARRLSPASSTAGGRSARTSPSSRVPARWKASTFRQPPSPSCLGPGERRCGWEAERRRPVAAHHVQAGVEGRGVGVVLQHDGAARGALDQAGVDVAVDVRKRLRGWRNSRWLYCAKVTAGELCELMYLKRSPRFTLEALGDRAQAVRGVGLPLCVVCHSVRHEPVERSISLICQRRVVDVGGFAVQHVANRPGAGHVQQHQCFAAAVYRLQHRPVLARALGGPPAASTLPPRWPQALPRRRLLRLLRRTAMGVCSRQA